MKGFIIALLMEYELAGKYSPPITISTGSITVVPTNIFIPADTDKRVVYIIFRFFANGSKGADYDVFVIIRVINNTFHPVT